MHGIYYIRYYYFIYLYIRYCEKKLSVIFGFVFFFQSLAYWKQVQVISVRGRTTKQKPEYGLRQVCQRPVWSYKLVRVTSEPSHSMWLIAGPNLGRNLVQTFVDVCVRFFYSQAGGRIPFIPNMLAWRRRAALPLGPARGAQPWCAMLSVVPKAGQPGKSWVDPFQNQHYMHYCSYPPRVPSTQWKQQQQPQSQALLWTQGCP